MNSRIVIFDKKFRRLWKNYVFQTIGAIGTLFVLVAFLKLQNVVIVASIGASVFIVFVMPDNIISRPRNIIGGHIVGLFCGSICTVIPHSTFFHSALFYSLAVGLSIFLMVITNTEHPPASSTALGIAIKGFSWADVIPVIIGAIILALVHHLFKPYLKNLK